MAESQTQQLFRAAEEALAQGDQTLAFALLRKLITTDPNHTEAWVLLAEAVTDPQRKRECLIRALRLQPHHPVARQRLQELVESPRGEGVKAEKQADVRRTQPTSAVSAPATPAVSTQPVKPRSAAAGRAGKPQGSPRAGAVEKPPSTRRRFPFLLVVGIFSLGLLTVLTAGLLFAYAGGWLNFLPGVQALERWLSGSGEKLPAGLSRGYWMFDYQRPLPEGVYIGDLVLFADGRFWFGYLQGEYQTLDESTLKLCTRGERATSSPCFLLMVTQSSPNQVVLSLELTQSGKRVDNLPYQKVMNDTSSGDLRLDVIGRWQLFPSDPQTRLALGGKDSAAPEEAYVFTAAGELWAGGRMISTYRIEDGQLRVPDYFGPFGERFEVDSLGEWMILAGQINKPGILIALKRMP